MSARSDHLPIVLSVDSVEGARDVKRILRYEIMWGRESSLSDEITLARSAGKQVHHLGDVAYNLKVMEVLIKSVAQAIPTYVIEVFKLPATMCNELTQLIKKFW
jgi:hypothetical protein